MARARTRGCQKMHLYARNVETTRHELAAAELLAPWPGLIACHVAMVLRRCCSKPAVQELSWTKTFKKHCMLRDVCVQIHTRGKFKVPAWLRPLMAKHRNLKFVSINRKLHKISFDAAVRMPRSEESARLAVMRRDVGADGLASYSVTQHRGDMTEAAVGHFIEEMAVKRASSKDTVRVFSRAICWPGVPPPTVAACCDSAVASPLLV
jgi:hypothetical protein